MEGDHRNIAQNCEIINLTSSLSGICCSCGEPIDPSVVKACGDVMVELSWALAALMSTS